MHSFSYPQCFDGAQTAAFGRDFDMVPFINKPQVSPQTPRVGLRYMMRRCYTTPAARALVRDVRYAADNPHATACVDVRGDLADTDRACPASRRRLPVAHGRRACRAGS